MFLQYASHLTPPQANPANFVLEQHPAQLAVALEAAWRGGPPHPLHYVKRSDPTRVVWNHLIYAYMIENTRVFEIFRKVAAEFVNGEKLEAPSLAGQQWLRNTEELFFREAPPYAAFSLTSQLRADGRAVRRNAYYRMFGLDLNHGTDDGRPYPYEKPPASNREFVTTLEELLREVWRGIVNFTNTSGPRPTDEDNIASLARRLRDMLVNRRRNGNLAREEFWTVATLSWFHLTLSADTSIIVDLKAEGPSPEERLRKVGERVGLAPHGKTSHFIELAEPLALFLRMVETGAYSTPGTALLLISPPLPGQPRIQDQMRTIINRYSLATGRDLKARSVTVTA